MPECNLLKNHMCITVSGNWRPCCKFDETLLPWDKKFKIINLHLMNGAIVIFIKV